MQRGAMRLSALASCVGGLAGGLALQCWSWSSSGLLGPAGAICYCVGAIRQHGNPPPCPSPPQPFPCGASMPAGRTSKPNPWRLSCIPAIASRRTPVPPAPPTVHPALPLPAARSGRAAGPRQRRGSPLAPMARVAGSIARGLGKVFDGLGSSLGFGYRETREPQLHAAGTAMAAPACPPTLLPGPPPPLQAERCRRPPSPAPQ